MTRFEAVRQTCIENLARCSVELKDENLEIETQTFNNYNYLNFFERETKFEHRRTDIEVSCDFIWIEMM